MFFTLNYYGFILYFMFVISLWVTFIFFNQKKRKTLDLLISGSFVFLTLITFICVFLFRQYDAPDNINYIKIYSRFLHVGELKDSISADFGYVALLYTLEFFNFPEQYLIGFLYSLILIIFSISLIKISESIQVFLILFLVLIFSWGFIDILINTQRQGISIALITLALAYRVKGETCKNIFFMLLACSFHWTGYIFLMLTFFSMLFSRFSSIKLLVLSTLVFLCSIINSTFLFSIVLSVVDVVSIFIEPLRVLSVKINWYLSSGVVLPLFLKLRISFELVLFITFSFLFFCFTREGKRIASDKNILLEMSLIIILSSFVTWSEYAFRVYNLMIPYFFFIYGHFLNYERKRNVILNKNVFTFVTCIFIVSHLTYWRSGIFFSMYHGGG